MNIWQDLRLGARMLLKDRVLTFAAISTLALGIAATTTMFTIVNGAMLRDLPFDQPDRIVALSTQSGRDNRGVSYLDLQDWRTRASAFEDVAGFAQVTMNISDDQHSPERFIGAYLSVNAFSLIGHQPALGRPFVPDDERPGAPPVVMLGDGVWQNRYQSDRAVLGRTIRVNGIPSTVIGVMGEGFKFPLRADVWQPLTLLAPETLRRRDARALSAVARLRGGATMEQGRADLGIVMAGLAREYPATNADLQPRVTDYRFVGVGGQISIVMYSLMGAVLFVLLIACANVANLLLSRAAGRTREVSVRIALGASRWQIVRQLLVEGLVLAATAGVIGLGLAVAGGRVFTRAVTGTGEPYWLQFTMDWRVLMVFAAVCLGTALLFGLAPALHTSSLNISEALNESGQRSAGTVRARRWAGALVVLQLALAPMLLTGAGLMMRDLLAAYETDPGIRTAGLVRMRLDLTEQNYPSPSSECSFIASSRNGSRQRPTFARRSQAARRAGTRQSEQFPSRTAPTSPRAHDQSSR